jgi:tetratricopeptide (TPR) repeat protein
MRAAIILVALCACAGGNAKDKIGSVGHKQKEKLDPVDPKAQKAFDDAMRKLRLGGPEANETARDRLREAVKADAKLWEAWHDLGVLAWKDGDDDEAIDDFTKALAIKKDHAPTLLARAEAHKRAGHKKEARGDYEAALRQTEEDDPNRPQAAARLAALLRDSEAYDEAVDILREVVRVSGASAKIYTELGHIYIAQKRLELAQLVLAKALELDPKDPAVYNAFAILAQKQGKAQEAFERFDKAAELDANYIDARFNKASVLLDAGDYTRAKVELEAIVQKRPDDYAALVALGVAHRGLKEFAEAKKTWERVIKEASKRSSARADAMFDVAILKIDFTNDTDGGKADLERYMQEAPSSHSKRQAADDKCKEVKCK